MTFSTQLLHFKVIPSFLLYYMQKVLRKTELFVIFLLPKCQVAAPVPSSFLLLKFFKLRLLNHLPNEGPFGISFPKSFFP
ncbi:hypothetical protein QD47_15385 [Paenibacillus terrae]|uniref:Uncharacterized protein n=1 Tax=Paenibacillus terrae TaxID=159743 RepID=A0A0D7X0M1_9BACL|nr:hypothetical protein QD47_15385 [Paenibacillus terrae]